MPAASRAAPLASGPGAFLLAGAAAYAGIRLTMPHPAWPSWLAYQVTDLLCLPLVLTGILLAHRIRRRDPAWTLPWWHGALAFLLCALWFEVAAPAWLGAGTGDARDVLAYAAGWAVFALGVNRRRAPARTAGRPGQALAAPDESTEIRA